MVSETLLARPCEMEIVGPETSRHQPATPAHCRFTRRLSSWLPEDSLDDVIASYCAYKATEDIAAKLLPRPGTGSLTIELRPMRHRLAF